MVKGFWLSLAFGLFLVLSTACIPNGWQWFELQPGNEAMSVQYATWYTSVPEWEEAIQYWNGHPLTYSYMEGVFEKVDVPNRGQVRILNEECPPGVLACVIPTFREGYLVLATIHLPQMWHNSSPEWKRAAMHHELGHVMGLAEFWKNQCEPHPYSGFLTIMGTAERWPVPPCITYPQTPDIIGSVCYNYGFDCPDWSWQFHGSSAGDGGPDSDGDGVEDAVDNCPAVPNPEQLDRDIDGVGDACEDDDDNDNFSDGDESYMTTDTLDNCPDDPQHAAWPPDFNNDQVVDIFDVNLLRSAFFSEVGDPNYDPRLDLNADGVIDIFDVNILNPYVFTSCVSTESEIVDAIKATEKYLDINVADDEGFVQATQPVTGRGAFFVNNDLWDDTFDIEQPEGLMYESGPNGPRLVGVFYFIPLWAVPDPPEGFIGGDDIWATHYGFCITENGEASEDVTEEQCNASGGVVYWDEIGHVLFAWLFRHNPDGVFQEVNPNVN